jgi:deoxycytidine triphosphate deaminase
MILGVDKVLELIRNQNIVAQGIRTDPEYKGNFVFMMSNISKKPFVIELGARIANMVFHGVDGKPNLYKGQWQGGRTFIEKKEKQVKQSAKVN